MSVQSQIKGVHKSTGLSHSGAMTAQVPNLILFLKCSYFLFHLNVKTYIWSFHLVGEFETSELHEKRRKWLLHYLRSGSDVRLQQKK